MINFGDLDTLPLSALIRTGAARASTPESVGSPLQRVRLCTGGASHQHPYASGVANDNSANLSQL